MKRLRTALIGLSAALLPTAAEASITITSNTMQAYADDRVGGASSLYFSGTSVPTTTTLDAIDGAASSKNSIAWSTSGGQTILSFDMDHQRAGTRLSYARTYVSSLYFTAISSEPYELSGYYHVTDVGANASGAVFQRAEFIDLSGAGYLFYNQQYSVATHDEQFTLGGTAGDFGGSDNYVYGSLTGNLIAGHSYQLYFFDSIQPKGAGDSGASAVGNITLTIGKSATPEPLSFIVWGGLAVAASWVGYGRRIRHEVLSVD